MCPPLTGRGTAAWPSSARLRRDGKASAFGPCGPHRVPDSAAASPGGADVSVCGEKACVSVCHSLPSHPWKPQSWARSPVQDALGVPARRSPAAHPWMWCWCGLRTGLFSFSHKVQACLQFVSLHLRQSALLPRSRWLTRRWTLSRPSCTGMNVRAQRKPPSWVEKQRLMPPCPQVDVSRSHPFLTEKDGMWGALGVTARCSVQ